MAFIIKPIIQSDHQGMLRGGFLKKNLFKSGYNRDITDTIRTCGYNGEITDIIPKCGYNWAITDTIRRKFLMLVHFIMGIHLCYIT